MLKTDIKLTTSVKEVLKKVPTNLHQDLKDSWVIFLKKMVEKIQEINPLDYKLVRVSAALEPRNLASLDADTPQVMCDAIVGIMHGKKQIQPNKVIMLKIRAIWIIFAENSGCKQELISWFQHKSNTSWRRKRFMYVDYASFIEKMEEEIKQLK